MVSRPGDPFSAFGMSRESRQKTLSSEIVKLSVRPLPEEGKPANFTGLVGKHEFELQQNSSRLIVNEPLELKLTITGGGALENMEAPSILKNPDLEEFESNGDLKIQNADLATKVFEYTFLPKSNLTLPATSVTLSYFDPGSMKYVPVPLAIREIVVAGGSAAEMKKITKDKKPESKLKKEQKIDLPNLAGPIFEGLPWWKNILQYLNVFLLGAILLTGFSFFVKKSPSAFMAKNTIPSTFSKGYFSIGDFTRWLEPLILKTGKSPSLLIRESKLSNESKKYFLDLIDTYGAKEFSHVKDSFHFVYNPKMFKELDSYLKSEKHENHT
jgi:hypothetical protein